MLFSERREKMASFACRVGPSLSLGLSGVLLAISSRIGSDLGTPQLYEDVFLMIRRKKCTIFTDAKESTTLGEVKKIIEGILKVAPENQRLFKDDVPMADEHKALSDYGYTSTVARAQYPATIGLVCKTEEGEWEEFEIHPLSNPPELPDVMKPQDANQTHQQEANAV